MKSYQLEHQTHELSPIYNKESKVLILGSFPSVLSRKNQFYYGNPSNRFWSIMSHIFGISELKTIDEKISFLNEQKIALWDVIASCDIKGSSDSSITNVVPNDLSLIINNSNVKRIFINGKKAFDLYNQYLYPIYKIEAYLLPSTSPLNARFSFDKLCDEWKIVKDYV